MVSQSTKYLLNNQAGPVTGNWFKLNGDERSININATAYSGSGVTFDISHDNGVTYAPATRLGAPASIQTNQNIILQYAPVGAQIRAVAAAGCTGVTVTILPVVVPQNEPY